MVGNLQTSQTSLCIKMEDLFVPHYEFFSPMYLNHCDSLQGFLSLSDKWIEKSLSGERTEMIVNVLKFLCP